MKVYQSPLFIGASVLLFYAIVLFIQEIIHPEGWGVLIAAPMLLIALTGFVIHFLFKKIIGTNFRIHFFIELALLLSVVLIMFVR